MRTRIATLALATTMGLVPGLVPLADVAAQPDAPPLLGPPAPTGVRAQGRVINANTGAPIAGATVSLEGTDEAALTDEDGRFSLGRVDQGATVIVSADGFELGLININGEFPGEIALLSSEIAGEVIEVRGQAPVETPGATALDRTEVSRVAGTGNDLLASLDVLPGITQPPTGPGGPGVVIRGSAPEDSKILIDGFEVPLLYHIGLRSIMPTESIAALNYLPGGFDVAYGRASSGIVAVTTRGGDGKAGGQAEVSVIDGGVLAKGPAGPGSLMVAMRRSTVDLILPSLLPEDLEFSLVTLPRYYDLQVRYDLPVNSRWSAAFSAIGTDDAVSAFGDDEPDPDERFSLRTRFIRLIGSARYHEGNLSANIAGSLLGQDFSVEVGRELGLHSDRYGATVRGQVTWNKKWMKGLGNIELRAGAEVDFSRRYLSLALPQFSDEGEPDAPGGGPPTDRDIMTRFDGTVDIPDLATWAVAAADLSPRVRLSTGVRVDAFLRTDDAVVQPRANLAVKLDKVSTARLVLGAYSRPSENQLELLDDSLDPERATHLIFGLERTFFPGFKVQTQAYYTDRYNLLTRTPMGNYVNQGEGKTIGAELLATLRHGPWFGFVSYSLTRSTRIDSDGADERLFDYDQPHDLNVSASWQSGRWQLGARFQYTSGLPYTPVLGAIYDSDADTYIPLYDEVNSRRVPGHHQLNVRIDYSWRWSYVKMTAFLDVQNAYLNAQLLQYTYNFDYSERNAFESIPILPSIGLKGVL